MTNCSEIRSGTSGGLGLDAQLAPTCPAGCRQLCPAWGPGPCLCAQGRVHCGGSCACRVTGLHCPDERTETGGSQAWVCPPFPWHLWTRDQVGMGPRIAVLSVSCKCHPVTLAPHQSVQSSRGHRSWCQEGPSSSGPLERGLGCRGLSTQRAGLVLT